MTALTTRAFLSHSKGYTRHSVINDELSTPPSTKKLMC